jgi:peptidoglycan L-alanyl-D-glutamate endopeptidase CwlK
MLHVKSESKLVGVAPELVKVVRDAAEHIPFPVLVTEGVRTLERQKALYEQGRTKPGKIVTWTLKSKHIEGKAVDLVPYIDNAIPWNDGMLFVAIGTEMKKAARRAGIKIRWGYDWDDDGVLQEKGESDGPHFELV